MNGNLRRVRQALINATGNLCGEEEVGELATLIGRAGGILANHLARIRKQGHRAVDEFGLRLVHLAIDPAHFPAFRLAGAHGKAIAALAGQTLHRTEALGGARILAGACAAARSKQSLGDDHC